MHRRNGRTLSTVLSVLVLAAGVAAQKPPAGGGGGGKAPAPAAPVTGAYETALARYKECIRRLPFRYHTEGREKLAQTHTPEALKQLIADYTGSKAYPEYTRYTVASLFGRFFLDKDSVEPLLALRKSCDKPVDTWLWFNAMRGQVRNGGGDDVATIAHDDKNALHRAAALAALGAQDSDRMVSSIVTTCVEFPKAESERAVLLGAMSGAILDNKRRVNDAEFRKALTAYAGLLAPAVKLSEHLQLQVGRHLQWVLNAPAPFVDQESWVELLQHGDINQKKDTHTVTQQKFFGIETDGERICYVLDLSDSMLEPVSPAARPPSARAPVTGGHAPPKKKEKGVVPDESDLPWEKIVSRFDLARENLRISLERLPKEKWFSVIIFGDESKTLATTKSMVRATKANIDHAMEELDAITAESAKAHKLMGQTNMHKALRDAFGLTNKGIVEDLAYVDPATLTEGCDTIFLLSDGAPSWDEFAVTDKDYFEDEVVKDTESKIKAPRTPMLHYYGPYVVGDWLGDDVARMNAFRRVRIHCIAIGEANTGLMRQLADLGHGMLFEVGKESDNRKTAGGK
jgi:hypothetical protein